MYRQSRTRTERGFSLIELLVVMTVIGVLAGILYATFSDGNEAARDAERKSDLRTLQNAIEQYYQKYGNYPEGCNGPGNWSGGGDSYACSGNAPYIIGLAPEFIPSLPYDPRPKDGEGYVYVSDRDDSADTGGHVYKLMAMETVESEIVHYCSEFASCDIKGAAANQYFVTPAGLEDFSDCADMGPGAGGKRESYTVWKSTSNNEIDPNVYGYCAVISTNPSSDNNYSVAPNCYLSNDPNSTNEWTSEGGNGRFETSYGVWGGIHPDSRDPDEFASSQGRRKVRYLYDTTQIICK